MALALCVVFFLFAATNCFAQTNKRTQFITEVTKGNLEFLDKLREIGSYGIKHGDCIAEMDEREVYCPDQHVLAALKIRVDEEGGEVNIKIPKGVVGSIYGISMQNRWRITIMRRNELCRSSSSQSLTMVSLYTACYPLLNNGVKAPSDIEQKKDEHPIDSNKDR